MLILLVFFIFTEKLQSNSNFNLIILQHVLNKVTHDLIILMSGILSHVLNKVTHDCGGGSTPTSTNSGERGASKFTRTEMRCRSWCIEPKFKGEDKLLE